MDALQFLCGIVIIIVCSIALGKILTRRRDW